jgi:hypothetical protein
VNHRARLGWTLGVSLVLWAPVAMRIIKDQVDLPIGGLYYLIALFLAWFGTGIILTLASGYTARSRQEAQRAMDEIREIERRHQVEALEERRRNRELDESSDDDAHGMQEAGAYDDDAPAMPRPRRSDGEAEDDGLVD